jgi:hypothetical protein
MKVEYYRKPSGASINLGYESIGGSKKTLGSMTINYSIHYFTSRKRGLCSNARISNRHSRYDRYIVYYWIS